MTSNYITAPILSDADFRNAENQLYSTAFRESGCIKWMTEEQRKIITEKMDMYASNWTDRHGGNRASLHAFLAMKNTLIIYEKILKEHHDKAEATKIKRAETRAKNIAQKAKTEAELAKWMSEHPTHLTE